MSGITLEPKPRRGCSLELPVFLDSVFEAHRLGLLSVFAVLQGIFLILFPLFLRVPSCADVVSPFNAVQSNSLWTLEILGILLSLFSNNKYASGMWLLAALAVSVTQVVLLLAFDFQYCSSGVFERVALEDVVPSSLSTSLPSSVPQLVIAIPVTVVLFVDTLNLLLAISQLMCLFFLVSRVFNSSMQFVFFLGGG